MKGIPRLINCNDGIFALAIFIFTLVAFCSATSPEPALAADLGLIEASELSKDVQAWAVLDGRPKSDWLSGHIPGAHSFSWDDYTRTDEKGTPYRVWPPKDLAQALARMGIDENTPVVVYGDADKSWGGEGWVCWVLSWLGHKGPVRILTGGIKSWSDNGYPIGTEPEKGPSSEAVHYQFNLHPELDIRASELEAKGNSMVLIDTRSNMEWLMGHLPKAIHIPWTDFYTGANRCPLNADSLKKLLSDHGVAPDRPIVYYCAGGIRSGYAWTVHTLCGLPQARNYEGGMEDWKRHPSK